MKLIAEIRKATPHGGLIAPIPNPVELAKEYTRLGASVISVVTTPGLGDKSWLKQVRDVTHLPILRSDIVQTERDVKESKDLGVTQQLLIAEFYSHSELFDMCFWSNREGVKPVVEFHTPYGYQIATKVDTARILINNRNFRTGEVKILNSVNYMNRLSDQFEVTTAGGYGYDLDVIGNIRDTGYFDYMLIGKALLQSTNLEETFKKICQNISSPSVPV